MVLKTCCVAFFDKKIPVYHSGETVAGTITFDLPKAKKLADLTFEAKGETRCNWTQHEGTGKNRRTVRYHSHETHFKTETSLLIGYKRENGNVTLQAGHHSFSFTFALSPDLPTAMEGIYGSVRYTIKITAVKRMKFDDTVKIPFYVILHNDLNRNPAIARPTSHEISKSFNLLFISKGAMSVVMTLPISGFVPGQSVHMQCHIKNPSKVKVMAVEYSLKQHITFVCVFPRTSRRYTRNKIVKYSGIGADKGQEVSYPVSFVVPALPPSSLYENLIKTEYFLKVKVNVRGMHTDSTTLIPITIGTIPLYSAQGYYPNNTHNGVIGFSIPSTSAAEPLPCYEPAPPSAPHQQFVSDEPPPYHQLALPTYEESQTTHKMAESDPDDENSNVIYAPIYPVYRFPQQNEVK